MPRLDELAARYADECARTLIEHQVAELTLPKGAPAISAKAEAHSDAVRAFEQAFPKTTWQSWAEPGLVHVTLRNAADLLLAQLEERRP